MTPRLTTTRALLPTEALAPVRSWPSEGAHAWTVTAVRQPERDAAITAIVAIGVGGTRRGAVATTSTSCWCTGGVAPVSRGRRSTSTCGSMSRPRSPGSWRRGTTTSPPPCATGGRSIERDGWWTRLRADWDARLALPSAADARARARETARRYDEMRALGDLDAAAEFHLATLTHFARAALSDAGVFPRSRPELAEQLRGIDEGNRWPTGWPMRWRTGTGSAMAPPLHRRYGPFRLPRTVARL